MNLCYYKWQACVLKTWTSHFTAFRRVDIKLVQIFNFLIHRDLIDMSYHSTFIQGIQIHIETANSFSVYFLLATYQNTIGEIILMIHDVFDVHLELYRNRT